MAGYTREEYESSRVSTPVVAAEGSVDWAEQNSGNNAPELKPIGNAVKGTLDAHEQGRDGGVGETKGAGVVEEATAPPADAPAGVTDEQKNEAIAGYDAEIAAMEDAMKRYAPESEEDRKRRERQERSSKIVAAISDGIRAVSNLWFTSQYAPNAYNHDKQSMVRSETARFDKLRAERDANADRYYNYAIQRGKAVAGRAKTLRELEAQHQAQQLARAKADQDAKRFEFEQSLWPDKQAEQKGKTRKAEQDAISAQNKAAVSADLAAAEVDAARARAESSRASAGASRARAGYYNNGVESHHFRGKKYLSDKDYTKDVTEAARDYNERHKDEDGFVPIVTEYKEETAYGSQVVARKPEEYAGEVERRLAEEERDNTPPSRRNKNNNTPPSRR